MSATTTRLALPYPQPTDPNNVPADIQRLANALDTAATAWSTGLDANRPTSTTATAGRVYYATDTTKAYFDVGGSWVTLNSAVTSVTTKGDVLIASGNAAMARLPVGANGQALVANSAATNGVDWESQLGMPLSLAGAVAATRYVGGIADCQIPPATGTFAVGDYLLCQTGQTLVCTTAGTAATCVWKTVGVIIPTDLTKPGLSKGDVRYVDSSVFPMQVWRGATLGWRGTTGAQTYSQYATTNVTTQFGNVLGVASVSVPDPGVPYIAQCSGYYCGNRGSNVRVDLQVTQGSTGGTEIVHCQGNVTVTATANYGPTVAMPRNAGPVPPGAAVPFYLNLMRGGGDAGAGFDIDGSQTYLRVEIKPALGTVS